METIQRVGDKLAQNFGGPAQNLGSSQFSLDDVPDLSGKVALVTGGSEGIGFGTTHTLLSHNISKLFFTSLKPETGHKALQAIEEGLGKEVRDRVVYIDNDLSDWSQTAKVANDIASQTDRLDIVVNNAARGIMTRQLAPTNGTDLHFAINHAGHVVMLSHLLPLLKKTAEQNNTVRIVNMSSNLHESAPSECKFASVEELNKDYGPNAQYSRAKLMNLLHARYLNKHLHSKYPNILINAVHPGIVDTAQTNVHIHEAYPILGNAMSTGMKPFKKSPFEGCVSAVYAATTTDGSGQYICPPCQVEKGSDMSNDMQLAENLMKLTREVVEEKTYSDSRAKGCPFSDY